jgi:hypothetical protein
MSIDKNQGRGKLRIRNKSEGVGKMEEDGAEETVASARFLWLCCPLTVLILAVFLSSHFLPF